MIPSLELKHVFLLGKFQEFKHWIFSKTPGVSYYGCIEKKIDHFGKLVNRFPRKTDNESRHATRNFSEQGRFCGINALR